MQNSPHMLNAKMATISKYMNTHAESPVFDASVQEKSVMVASMITGMDLVVDFSKRNTLMHECMYIPFGPILRTSCDTPSGNQVSVACDRLTAPVGVVYNAESLTIEYTTPILSAILANEKIHYKEGPASKPFLQACIYALIVYRFAVTCNFHSLVNDDELDLQTLLTPTYNDNLKLKEVPLGLSSLSKMLDTYQTRVTHMQGEKENLIQFLSDGMDEQKMNKYLSIICSLGSGTYELPDNFIVDDDDDDNDDDNDDEDDNNINFLDDIYDEIMPQIYHLEKDIPVQDSDELTGTGSEFRELVNLFVTGTGAFPQAIPKVGGAALDLRTAVAFALAVLSTAAAFL